MGLFRTKPTPKPAKHSYRKKDTVTVALESEAKEKIKARERAAQIARQDPDTEREYISKLIGVDIKPPDPDKKAKQEIKSLITSEALKAIKEDPELKAEFARQQITEIMGESASPRHDYYGRTEEFGNPVSSISQALEQIDDINELKEKLGSGSGNGKGFLSALADPEVVKMILALLVGRVGSTKTTESSESSYVVRIDGQTTQVSRAQFDQFLKENRVTPIAEIGPAKPAEVVKDPTEQVAIPSVVELPIFLKDTDFTVISGWFDTEPDDFVENMKAEVTAGADEAKLIWGFLTTATYDGIVEHVMPYKSNPKVSELVEKVLSEEGKVWVEKVLELVKEGKS